jgi:hypothetical protein
MSLSAIDSGRMSYWRGVSELWEPVAGTYKANTAISHAPDVIKVANSGLWRQ